MSDYKAQSSIYLRLWDSVRNLYESSLQAKAGRKTVSGFNDYAFFALPAFVLTVATWESYLNFVFFSLMTKQTLGVEIYEKAKRAQEDLGRLSIRGKTLMVPLLIFGDTFDKGSMPFQDFDILVTIRNHVTHNYVHSAPEKAVAVLREKGLLLANEIPGAPDLDKLTTWSEDLQTFEVIRWCLNTLAAMSQGLVALHECKHPNWRPGFPVFDDGRVLKLYKKYDISVG
jgi:hypothetical protein